VPLTVTDRQGSFWVSAGQKDLISARASPRVPSPGDAMGVPRSSLTGHDAANPRGGRYCARTPHGSKQSLSNASPVGGSCGPGSTVGSRVSVKGLPAPPGL
jgi:hypothetical protein